jgi:two-component system cell cycle response regulator DivK
MTGKAWRAVSPAEARVLMVEDNVSSHTGLIRLLALAGVSDAHCVTRYSGQAVRQVAESQTEPFDLILLDLRLPQDDGYEVLRQIRAEPFFNTARVVAVTGYVTPDEIRKARQAGFDGFLGKPLLPGRFPSQLKRILNGEPVWESDL